MKIFDCHFIMIIEDYFFEGTGFRPVVQEAIKTDLCNLISKYPQLKPARQQNNVVILGTIPLDSFRFSFPLLIVLPPKFPFEAPAISVPHPKNDFTLFRLEGLNRDGTIVLDKITNWAPKTPLLNLVNEIHGYFNKNKPFSHEDAEFLSFLDLTSLVNDIKYQEDLPKTVSQPIYQPSNNPQTYPQTYPQQIPQQIPQNIHQQRPQSIPQNIPQQRPSKPLVISDEDIEKAMEQAVSLISSAEAVISEGYNATVEMKLMEHCSKVTQNLVNDLEKINLQLKEQLKLIVKMMDIIIVKNIYLK